MKAKLFELKIVDEMDVGNPPKPEIHKLEVPKLGLLSDDYSGLNSMPEVNYKRHIYKLVLLRDINKKKQIYYIDYANFKEVMPLIDHIIREETEDFKRKEVDYEVNIACLINQLSALNKKWFVRFYKWTKNLLKQRNK